LCFLVFSTNILTETRKHTQTQAQTPKTPAKPTNQSAKTCLCSIFMAISKTEAELTFGLRLLSKVVLEFNFGTKPSVEQQLIHFKRFSYLFNECQGRTGFLTYLEDVKRATEEKEDKDYFGFLKAGIDDEWLNFVVNRLFVSANWVVH